MECNYIDYRKKLEQEGWDTHLEIRPIKMYLSVICYLWKDVEQPDIEFLCTDPKIKRLGAEDLYAYCNIYWEEVYKNLTSIRYNSLKKELEGINRFSDCSDGLLRMNYIRKGLILSELVEQLVKRNSYEGRKYREGCSAST